MYQHLALTSLRDSHRLPTRHIREPGTDRRLFFSLPYFHFRTSVSVLRFPFQRFPLAQETFSEEVQKRKQTNCPPALKKCKDAVPDSEAVQVDGIDSNECCVCHGTYTEDVEHGNGCQWLRFHADDVSTRTVCLILLA